MILYHGSTNVISKPVFGVGRTTNDYGRGLYCTESSELAKEWACMKGTDGYANIYRFDISGLKVLDLNAGKCSILTWLAILAKYRTFWENGSISREAKEYLQQNFFISPEEYDVVRGYRADDSYFTFAKNFVGNGISLEQLKNAMHLGALGEQIVLKSRAAFSQITYIGSLVAEASLYTSQAQKRDREARVLYRKLAKETSYSKGIFMADIIREGMTADDQRLQ